MSEIKKPGAPLGNQNPKKSAGELADAQVQFRCRSEDKGRWLKASEKVYGKGRFTEFMKDAANRFAAEILNG